MTPRSVQSQTLNGLMAWSLLAFGAVYVWALVPVTAAAIVLLVATRPPVLREGNNFRLLDRALVATLGVIAFQLVPLPRPLLGLLSRATVTLADALSLSGPRTFITISIWPAATLQALAIAFTAIAVFWVARELFRYQGIRRAIRTAAICGAIASFVGIVQRKSASPLVYGFWRPVEAGAWPFGPFVNRNQFATWILMAIPLCAGYLMARRPGRVRNDYRPLRVRAASALDGRAIWLMTVIGLMAVALVSSQSRSGLVGLAGVLVVGWMGTRWRASSNRHFWLLLAAIVVGTAVLLWGDVPALLSRLDNTQTLEPRDRVPIWRDTVSLIRQHWLTGTGAGAYERAMVFYQQTDRTYYDNQAHNQFLQVAADGGLLLVVPVLVALIVVVGRGLKALRHDRTGMYWIRLGALAGLSGVAIQSLWETGLRAPGNAVLSAVLAAILVHEPVATTHTTRPGP